MESVRTTIAALLRPHRSSADAGQGLAEYALILALIAIVAIVALIFLGGQVSKILSYTGVSI
jgi:Flp pilus assembly pilin Flp